VPDDFRDLVLLVGADPLFLQPQDWRVVLLLTGRSVARLSRLVWDQEVASSNLAAPTKTNKAFASAKAFPFFRQERYELARTGTDEQGKSPL
jgi:hypothetical protein